MPDFAKLAVYWLPGLLQILVMVNRSFPVTEKTRVRQRATRANYQRDVAYAVLDEALFCSVGFLVDAEPYVMPMAYARWDDRLILHGSEKSRLAQSLAAGARVCVTVTLLDGLVLARSWMHHSLNYRSVVIVGGTVEVTNPAEKVEALRRVVDHVVFGRSRGTRKPNPRELRATRVLALPIETASVKMRTGGPLDDTEDLAHASWAGSVPLSLKAGVPVPDPLHPPTMPLPAELVDYGRPAGS